MWSPIHLGAEVVCSGMDGEAAANRNPPNYHLPRPPLSSSSSQLAFADLWEEKIWWKSFGCFTRGEDLRWGRQRGIWLAFLQHHHRLHHFRCEGEGNLTFPIWRALQGSIHLPPPSSPALLLLPLIQLSDPTLPPPPPPASAPPSTIPCSNSYSFTIPPFPFFLCSCSSSSILTLSSYVFPNFHPLSGSSFTLSHNFLSLSQNSTLFIHSRTICHLLMCPLPCWLNLLLTFLFSPRGFHSSFQPMSNKIWLSFLL